MKAERLNERRYPTIVAVDSNELMKSMMTMNDDDAYDPDSTIDSESDGLDGDE